MDLLRFLNKALWISAIVFALYWLIKYFYNKFKPHNPAFFYFVSVEKGEGDWKVRIESPADDFQVEISILKGQDLLAQKKARLNAGLNKVTVKSPELKSDSQVLIKINASDQKLERLV